jgi:carbonic anhydrase
MRLLDAIFDANQRRVAGDAGAVVSFADHKGALPLAALTCIDPRLNKLLPDMLGLPEEQFIWLRNAGNIITGPLSSTMRSLALGCAVKGAKEIAIIGHSDCQVGKTTMLDFLNRLSALGVDRHRLPENLVEYFGLFSSERQNVLRGVEFVRGSPLIGTKVPVHGLLIDIKTGRLECVSNGDDAPAAQVPGKAGQAFAMADQALAKIGAVAEELNVPHTKIGEIVSTAGEWLHRAEHVAAGISPAAKRPPKK